jgi:hypothetical protein
MFLQRISSDFAAIAGRLQGDCEQRDCLAIVAITSRLRSESAVISQWFCSYYAA